MQDHDASWRSVFNLTIQDHDPLWRVMTVRPGRGRQSIANTTARPDTSAAAIYDIFSRALPRECRLYGKIVIFFLRLPYSVYKISNEKLPAQRGSYGCAGRANRPGIALSEKTTARRDDKLTGTPSRGVNLLCLAFRGWEWRRILAGRRGRIECANVVKLMYFIR